MTRTPSNIGRRPFEAELQPGRHVWISDGVEGYARPLGEGETWKEAMTEFAATSEGWERLEGESDESLARRIVDQVCVYRDGVCLSTRLIREE